MSDDRTKRATELALSCRRCGHPTDAEYNHRSKVWTTRCECGKTSKHSAEYINKEVEELMITIPIKRK